MATENADAKADQVDSQSPGHAMARVYDPIDEVDLTVQEMRQQLALAHSFLNKVRTLSEIVLQIDAARSRSEILEVLESEVKFLIDHEVSFVALLNASRTHYLIHPVSGIAEATEMPRKHFLISQGMPGWVIDHRIPISNELSACPSFHEEIEGVLQDLGMKHFLIVPLHTSDDTIGALALSSARFTGFSDQELLIAQLLALHVAVAIKNVSLFDAARKRIAQIELVNEIAEKLTSTLDLDELLNSAAETIREAFNYFDVTIFMVNKEASELILVAHSGNYVDFLPHGYRQKMSEGIVGWVASHGKNLLVNDVSEEARYVAYEYHSTRSELAVPILVEGDVVGILNVEDTKLHAFDETDAIVLETLCDQLGSAVKNAKLYDQVRKANTTLTELDRMKSDFLGIVSHDFRSPLASIILAAKAMLKRSATLDPKRYAEYLTIIVDQANKLSQLAEDTLSIAKIESGQLTYFFKVVNVERLIKDAVALVNFSRRHTVEYRVDNNVAYIKGDQTKLRQVVQNLLSNAVKYSPKGGLISVTAEPFSGDQILFTVSDEGIGIPPEQIGKLFQKFSRVDTLEAREIKGSGLGLWICQEIVRAHGGRIWVESEPGKGSTFKFTLKSAHHENS